MGGYGDKHVRRAAAKHGGLLPMHLTDADSGKTVYDNRDATAMARLYAARGGEAANMTGPRDRERYYESMVDKYWREESVCPQCKSVVHVLKWWNLEIDRASDISGIVRPPGYCWTCWVPKEWVALKEEEKEEYERTKSYITRYLETHYNYKEAQILVIKEFLEKHTKEEIPEIFK